MVVPHSEQKKVVTAKPLDAGVSMHLIFEEPAVMWKDARGIL
jgi:hypothetical protein